MISNKWNSKKNSIDVISTETMSGSAKSKNPMEGNAIEMQYSNDSKKPERVHRVYEASNSQIGNSSGQFQNVINPKCAYRNTM